MHLQLTHARHMECKSRRTHIFHILLKCCSWHSIFYARKVFKLDAETSMFIICIYECIRACRQDSITNCEGVWTFGCTSKCLFECMYIFHALYAQIYVKKKNVKLTKHDHLSNCTFFQLLKTTHTCLSSLY